MAQPAYASVKLPGSLVEQARQAAQPLRRSVASQIEYWATLGQIVEHTGLSVQDARAAIEQYEAAAQQATAPASVDALTGRLLAAQARGSLAERVREVVRENRARAAAAAPCWFHLLAGPNGAGKSTLYRALVRQGLLGPPLEFVNADLHEQAHLQHIADPLQRSEAARAWADARRAALIAARTPFASETVFSHPSKLALIEQARQHGFTVALHVVALDGPERLVQRVARRVREGGHPVPPERILARYPRTLALLAQAVHRADVAYLYDGADVEAGGPQLVAVCTPVGATVLATPLPRWASDMLATR